MSHDNCWDTSGDCSDILRLKTSLLPSKRHRADREGMFRQISLILLAFAARVIAEKIDLKAVCDADTCPGQDLIQMFTGKTNLTFLSGDGSCHIENIDVQVNTSLYYEIIGDKNYSSVFVEGCFRPENSTVIKELFLPIETCADMIVNVECKNATQDVFLIAKQMTNCSTNGLREVEEKFGYQVNVGTLGQCGQEETGIWRAIVNWFKRLFRTVRNWF